MYISIPKEKAMNFSLRQRFIDESNVKKVFDRITASSEVLERLVFHQVRDMPVSRGESLLIRAVRSLDLRI